MKRLLVFTTLFPPLVLFVYITADQLLRDGFPDIGFLAWLVGIAYVLAVIPAWLTAGVDWALSAQPLYVRLIATCRWRLSWPSLSHATWASHISMCPLR
jgi:hypothetical protein